MTVYGLSSNGSMMRPAHLVTVTVTVTTWIDGAHLQLEDRQPRAMAELAVFDWRSSRRSWLAAFMAMFVAELVLEPRSGGS
jgi:hypothetical protein